MRERSIRLPVTIRVARAILERGDLHFILHRQQRSTFEQQLRCEQTKVEWIGMLDATTLIEQNAYRVRSEQILDRGRNTELAKRILLAEDGIDTTRDRDGVCR